MKKHGQDGRATSLRHKTPYSPDRPSKAEKGLPPCYNRDRRESMGRFLRLFFSQLYGWHAFTDLS